MKFSSLVIFVPTETNIFLDLKEATLMKKMFHTILLKIYFALYQNLSG